MDVNISAIRAKYAAYAASRDLKDALHLQEGDEVPADGSAHQSLSLNAPPTGDDSIVESGAVQSISDVGSAPIAGPGARIARMRICDVCKGNGVVKELYNHMVMDKTCRRCDGDGVVEPLPVSAAGEAAAGSVAAGAGPSSASAAGMGAAQVSAAQPGDGGPPELEDA